MSTYSVAQVESLTGIKAHTLRIWERRYNFLNPERTDTNIRYYSDEQLRKLLNFGILIKNGYRISKLDQMPDQKVSELVTEIVGQPINENGEDIDALTLAMLKMDEEAFNTIFKRKINQRGLLNTITEVIYPFLHHVGVLWGTKKAIPAQEHFISSLIRQKIVAAIDALPQPPNSAPKILLGLMEGEDHEIGLLLACFIARELGWKTYYLGCKVPVNNVPEIIDLSNSDVLMTMFVAPSKVKTEKTLKSILKNTDVPVIISGNPENFENLLGMSNVYHAKDPNSFVNLLRSFEP